MSEGLLTQWRDRVVEAETEISVVQEDISAIAQQRKDLKQDISRYDKLVQREKQDMLQRLEEVEAQAHELEERCQLTQQQKARVEEVYVKTLDDYESMHAMVRTIQSEEQRLREREDLEVVLQRESMAWAEEEHTMRTRLNNAQSALKARRKQRQQEMRAMETELAGVERHLHQLRQQQQQQQQCRHAPPGLEERQFIAANATTSVPTRALRSCLKGGLNNNTGNTHSNQNSANNKEALGPHAASAPVSRATSQALTAGEMVPTPIGTPYRAFSYAAGKKMGGRKRDVLGDATNQ